MNNMEKFLKMLQSPKASVRYEACEELRLANVSSPEIILALETALKDEDADVAERARAALYSRAHRQLAIDMGKIKPQKQLENIKQAEQMERSNKLEKGKGWIKYIILQLIVLITWFVMIITCPNWTCFPIFLWVLLGSGFILILFIVFDIAVFVRNKYSQKKNN